MALADYESALKSFIHDDDKLVTYKWISKEFEIHVNVAKDVLKQYWEKYRTEESITATFLLMGQLKDGSIRVEVVKESNLKVAKEKFVKVDCEHLYSLQKSLQDIELLAFAGEGDLRFSAIKCNEKFIRNDEEIESLRYIGNVKKEESKTVGVNKISNKAPEKQESKNVNASAKEKESKNVNVSVKEKESKNISIPVKEKAKNDANKKKGITETEKSSEKEKSGKPKSETKASPTEKKGEKKVSPPSKPSSNTKSNGKTSKKPMQSKQSGFNNLFGKVQAKPQVLNKPEEDTDSNKEKISSLDIKEKEETKVKEDKKIEQKEKKDSPEKENKNQQSKKEKKSTPKIENKIDNKSKSKNTKEVRGQKRNRSQESNASSKRKRIVIADSSDDESSKSNNEEEEEEEPMEIIEEPPKVARKRSPSPPAEKRENGKRMVRKTIDKIFKDEDGYLVTKRVHVYEAVSDDEDTIQSKKEESKKAKPETKVETKKKQTSLMSFFKKS